MSGLVGLLLAPAMVALALLLSPLRRRAPAVMVFAAAFNAAVSFAIALRIPEGRFFGGYVLIDATARLFLVVVGLIFFGIAGYAWNRQRTTPALASACARFARLSLAFMAAANVTIVSNHLLAGWMALEATTLLATPLILQAGRPASLTAAWRYLLFSSAGLAIAFLGLACLARSADDATYFVDVLKTLPIPLSNPWRRIGLSLVVLGYGTKLGLAPMFSWLPETYDEAPPSTTALLAAVQFNGALVCLLRVLQIYRAADHGLVVRELFAVGLLSMAVSTVSIVATTRYRRLIAYASINHAGVIAIGLAVGASASYGVILYVVSNAFIKAILFLTAGKIEAHYRTKDTREVLGLIKDLPYSGLFLMVGTFALLGLPPFGSFLGELIILSGLVRAHQILVFVVFCMLISLTFIATGRRIFPMIWGTPLREVHWPRQSFLSASPKLAFLLALVAMGLYMPAGVSGIFRAVAASVAPE